MSYECEECGTSFDTLSQLRLHDCSTAQVAAEADAPDESTPAGPVTESGFDRQELERDYPDVVGEIPNHFDDARAGDLSALARALAEYERVLTMVARGDAPGGDDLYTDLQFAYYEPLADGLDAAAQADGWDVLVEFATAYDPHEQDALPEVGHVIANAIGRSIIRTRRTDGVDAIPAAALAFLGAIPESVDEFHVAYEESYTYGWGIDHPDHSVADHLLALAEADPKFVKITLNTAFYVDQHAALDVFETLVTDADISGVARSALGKDIELTEFYFQAVADLETGQLLGPHAPPFWDEDDDLPRVVTVDPAVKQRLRELAAETGVADDFSEDWTLQDLDASLVSELTDLVGESSDENE